MSVGHTEKRLECPKNKIKIEIDVSTHFGAVSELSSAGIIAKDKIDNANETHFVNNVDNERTLGSSDTDDVMYADVLSDWEGFTIIVRIAGGRDSGTRHTILVFRSKDQKLPDQGLPDNFKRLAYRSKP